MISNVRISLTGKVAEARGLRAECTGVNCLGGGKKKIRVSSPFVGGTGQKVCAPQVPYYTTPLQLRGEIWGEVAAAYLIRQMSLKIRYLTLDIATKLLSVSLWVKVTHPNTTR